MSELLSYQPQERLRPQEVTVFENKPLIKNSIIERMFMRIAKDDWMKTFTDKATSEIPAVKASATAFASTKVERMFDYFVSTFERQGGNIDDLNDFLWSAPTK